MRVLKAVLLYITIAHIYTAEKVGIVDSQLEYKLVRGTRTNIKDGDREKEIISPFSELHSLPATEARMKGSISSGLLPVNHAANFCIENESSITLLVTSGCQAQMTYPVTPDNIVAKKNPIRIWGVPVKALQLTSEIALFTIEPISRNPRALSYSAV